MSGEIEQQALAELRAVIESKGEDGIKELLVRSPAVVVHWLSETVDNLHYSTRESVRAAGGNLYGFESGLISEMLAVTAMTKTAVQSGRSIDGGPVAAPPIDLDALEVILNYFRSTYGDSVKAWQQFTHVIRVAHLAKKMRGEIPASARTTGAGAGCGKSAAIMLGLVAGALLLIA
ncbi:MAG TPA: hypothetical protein VJP77_06195 [Planctomycetota bacterium]|nr:hypothetical protein [Planctomycetota bacterium]